VDGDGGAETGGGALRPCRPWGDAGDGARLRAKQVYSLFGSRFDKFNGHILIFTSMVNFVLLALRLVCMELCAER
jgi:hypothetical protein